MPAVIALARFAAAVALALAGLPVFAAGGGGSGGSAAPSAPDLSHELAAATLLIDRQDWAAAIAELERARRKDDRNAEVHNLLGYSLRKSGQLERAFEHYRTALRLDPNHLGAHEYIGEAYLIARRADKAREHLVALSRLCGEKCEQYQDLSKALAAYDAGTPLAQSAGAR